MKFGHHGANHPVVEIDSGRVMITSQNHGFAVQENTLPANVRADAPLAVRRHACRASSEPIGPRSRSKGTPRRAPGPHDLKPLFQRFTAAMKAYRHRAQAV